MANHFEDKRERLLRSMKDAHDAYYLAEAFGRKESEGPAQA